MIFWGVSLGGDQEPAERCDQELAFVMWHETAHHQSPTTCNRHFSMFGQIYNQFLTSTYAVLLHPSSLTRAPVMTHMPMMSQMSLFFIGCLFLPSSMVQSVVQRTASLACHQKYSSHLPLLVWILLVPSLLGLPGQETGR